MSILSGQAWVFGDAVNTDVMAPGLYFKAPIGELASHCMEAIDADFAANVQPGDIVVGGMNFGIGSAREQAPMAFKHLGVGAIIAASYGRIFYRNALNFGIPTLILPDAAEISRGNRLRVDPIGGVVENLSSDKCYTVAPLPQHLMEMVTAGGLMPYLKQRLAQETGQ